MRSCSSVAVAVLIAASSTPAAASDHTWRTLATIGEIGIPATAFGITVYEHDHNGLVSLAETSGATILATEALKYGVNERRPNGGNHSFPSGHTSAAFAGAGFLHARYGWKVGVPFEILAAGVGISRVHTHDHHWWDVVAGAAIGEGSAYLFTRRLDESHRVSAWGDTSGGGVALTAQF